MDLELRRLTYTRLVELGRPPLAAEVEYEDVVKGWRELHDAHALVLDPATDEILMAHPFSAVPTPYRVHADGRSWYANCAWDAFGICAALHVDGTIETACTDCGEELAVEVRDQQPSDRDLLWHCLVPARHWWDDIVFT
jgi:hypothetical protein